MKHYILSRDAYATTGVINEQDTSYLLTEFPPNVKEFIEKYELNPQSFIKPNPPATSINFKKNDGKYIPVGNMDLFSKNVDIYMNSVGVINLFNQMIQNKYIPPSSEHSASSFPRILG